MAAKWSEFDAEPGYWVKPSATRSKTKTHRIPLTGGALELVARRRQERDENSEWVFPSERTDQPVATLWQFGHTRARGPSSVKPRESMICGTRTRSPALAAGCF